MTPIERACRALCFANRVDPDLPWNNHADGKVMWENFIPQVRAMLLAIREPGPAALGAGSREILAPCPNSAAHAQTVWQAMIDATLE